MVALHGTQCRVAGGYPKTENAAQECSLAAPKELQNRAGAASFAFWFRLEAFGANEQK